MAQQWIEWLKGGLENGFWGIGHGDSAVTGLMLGGAWLVGVSAARAWRSRSAQRQGDLEVALCGRMVHRSRRYACFVAWWTRVGRRSPVLPERVSRVQEWSRL